MDDPWGSPWVDEIKTPNPIKPKADDFAVRPTTPIKAASLALEQKTNSPWDNADGDGFGDWAEGSVEGGGGLGLDENDDWGGNTGPGLGYVLTDEGSNTLSIPWNEAAVTSGNSMSELAPSLLPKDNVLRQPSPDPWAVDTTRDDANKDAPHLQAEQHDEGYTSQEFNAGMSAESGVASVAADTVSMVVVDEVLPGTLVSEHGISATKDINSIVEETNRTNVESVENLTPVESIDQDGEAEHVSSRLSSSPSEHSHHDGLAQDSPRTSLDEELKRPSMPRKVSSKVHELVQHFDGLAQEEEFSEPIAVGTGSQQQKSEGGEEGEEEMDDFGDFEDVQSEAEKPMDEGKADSPAQSPNVEDSETKTREQVIEQKEPRARFVRKDLGPVEFTVDTSIFDRLYPGIEAKPPSKKLFIPDTITRDSFSSTEERKTWYRISRYGTMRKYNAGDDENYVRVNWTQSQVRADALKIVARWIEEDRISGRVVLGGASKGSSIFGWNDPKAAPVPLAHAFEVKNSKQKITPTGGEPAVEVPREWPKGLIRTRSTSRTPSISKSRRKSSTKSTYSEATKLGTQLPTANFGWNATSEAESKPISPAHEKKASGSSFSSPSPSTKMPPALQPTSSRIPSLLPIEPVKRLAATKKKTPRPHSIAHTSISVPQSLTTSNFTNDDDDWGELVSSPSTNIPPVIPPSTGSHHKATRSLSSIFPSTILTAPVTNKSTPEFKPAEQDRWAMGLEEVLTPQTTNSMATNIANTSNAKTHTMPNNNYSAFSPAAQTANRPPAVNSIDPWASADFSFFETTGTPASKVPPAPITQIMPPKSVTFSPPAATPIPRRNQKSREEIEQDGIVQKVVQGLPDLSYMLRR